LIIPEGYRVVGREGTQLNLTHSAKILSYSPLEFIGSEDLHFVIQSTDSTGQGIVVMNAGRTSVLEYVTFYNLSNPSQDGWKLTGAVTFHESPVGISHTQFVGHRSEDALNIVRSEFSIDQTLFRETSFDAIDVDFSKGKITSSNFLNIGNDAIDASGSVIELEDIVIDGTGDKGLSAGERSQLIAARVDIRNAQIAVASKDKSQVKVQGMSVSDSVTGLAAYQKKTEFGPASMEVRGLEMTRVTTPYLVEQESSVIANKVAIRAKKDNVYRILYGEK
jgi:hypothetical protein